ncbi:MAG: peptidylprolyl isomerase [Nitrosomonadales bacterium]
MNKLISLIIVLALLTTAANANDIKVNGKKINHNLNEFIISELENQGTAIDEEMKKNITERLIELEIVNQAAVKEGITNNEKFLTETELNFLESVYKVYLKDFLKKHPITNKEIDASYQEYMNTFHENEYSGQHILTKTKKEAEKVYQLALAGDNFSNLAKQYSIDKGSSNNNGDLGWFSKTEMVDGFFKEAEKLKISEISNPFQTQFGWHILKINEVRAKKPEPKKTLEKKLKEEIQKEKLKKEINRLKAEAKIER